jgi:hypothetical protein
MNKAKNIYKLAWVIWIIGSLLITASWFSIVPISWGLVGFVISMFGVLMSGYSHWVVRRERRSRVQAPAAHNVASFDDLETLLKEASNFLQKAAEKIRDLTLEPEKNVRTIGEAIVLVSEIRSQVYMRRPDLMPEHLKKK